MKLVRVGPPGGETPGVIDAEGKLRDLSGRIEDFSPAFFAEDWRRTLAESLEGAPAIPVDARTRFGVPIASVSKVVGVGMNYHEGVRRAKMATPAEPLLFIKSATCLAGPGDPIRLPRGADKLDWEVELGVAISKEANRVTVENAAQYILGYCVFNDLSERNWQNERGGEWCKGKSADGFGPCGPWLVTSDEVADPNRLGLWLSVNGTRYQQSNTSDMIFSVEYVVSYISQFMRLLPGDIVIMGTPPGTGWRQTPPRFLRPGDEVALGIEGLGEQRTRVQAG